MTFDDFEAKWKAHLGTECCPPVLGLAALSEQESNCIRTLTEVFLSRYAGYPGWKVLFSLLEKFPATMSVWLARKAGEAYEGGAFWDRFENVIGIEIPVNQRGAFADKFRTACRRAMRGWLAPEELGGFSFVAEFLHQAGLPLDRCDRFAQHVRKVERSYGLPDPDAPNAGSQLREFVLETLDGAPLPTLKRALRGPAGGRICEVALHVVLKDGCSEVNPCLELELRRVFQNSAPSALRRSIHQPYLRLGEDLGSLEIVGPPQDAALVSGSGVMWVLNGRRTPTPRGAEFVARVTDLSRAVLELEGTEAAAAAPRTFVLTLSDRTEPFILFDAATRRERRATGPIPAGSYWLLHRTCDSLSGADESYDWPDEGRTLSSFELYPGAEISLQSADSPLWRFECLYEPCFENSRVSVSCASGALIYRELAEALSVWLPAPEADEELLPQWSVSVLGVGSRVECKLVRSGEGTRGMIRCRLNPRDLGTVLPGMYRVELQLRHRARNRVEARSSFWFWEGLESYGKFGFRLVARPVNLVPDDCRGFTINENAIIHRSDQLRQHTLAFNIDGAVAEFAWYQPGISLESVERRPGERSEVLPQCLGSTFSASADSCRWLRIWFIGHSRWQIVVAGQVWQRSAGRDLREFIELSLANLAIAFPQGGDIRLHLDEGDIELARFTSPLCPVDIDRRQDDSGIELEFRFAESIDWVRVVVRDLESACEYVAEARKFGDAAACEFGFDNIPGIACTRRLDVHHDQPQIVLALRVPRRGWPVGSWLVELQVRRDESSEWEDILVNGNEYAPVFLHIDGSRSSARSLLLAASGGWGGAIGEPADVGEVLGLLQDLVPLHRRAISALIWQDLAWVKDAVHRLSRIADRIARRPNAEDFAAKLLDLASLEASHDLFVHLPGLLALPAARYAELPGGDPLNEALRSCAKLGRADSVVDLCKEDSRFFDFAVIGNFGNFHELATCSDDDTESDLNRFATAIYFQKIIGQLETARLAPDWEGGVALGRKHAAWAVAAFARRYNPADPDLAYANALLHLAPEFKNWLYKRLGESALMAGSAWAEPWLRVLAQDSDFVETAPRFASLFALAARSSAAGLLDWDAVMGWLEGKAGPLFTERGIAALVQLAPELFGYQLLLWELLVRTRPH